MQKLIMQLTVPYMKLHICHWTTKKMRTLGNSVGRVIKAKKS